MKNRFLLSLCFLYFAFTLSAQDIHFTQHYNTPQAVSPGLTGIFNGDQRFIGAYRGQWYSADAPYTTFYASFDQKYYNRKLKKAFMGFGGGINYDRAGDSRLTLAQLNLTGSYTYLIDAENLITGGLMVGAGQRSFDYGSLLWANQHDGDQVNAGAATGEDLDDAGYIYPDFGLGINYRAQKLNKRSHLDLGASIFHLHQPNQSFDTQGESLLKPRASFYLNQVLETTEKFDLYWNGLAQLQDKYFEGVIGAGGRWHLNQARGKELAVQAGVAWRLNEISDAAILATEVHYQYWRFGFSYDFNISEYKIASNRFGGPEVTLRYIIKFVKPVPVFRICPII